MKSIIVLIIVSIILIYTAFTQEIESVGEINIDTQELAKQINFQSTQFIFKSKQKTDFHYTFDILDIIKPVIGKINPNELNSLLFVFENPFGETVTAAYSDFDNLNSPTPAVLVYHEVTAKTGDSISVFEDEGNIDMSALDEKVAHFTTRRRIFLQITDIPVPEKQRMLENSTIIFPNDLNTGRWINGIDKIKIFKYKFNRTPLAKEISDEQGKPAKKAKPDKKK